MMDKLESIKKNDVRELTALPDRRKVIGCKWVLRKKFKANDILDKYKARLATKGFTQQPSVDFVDTIQQYLNSLQIELLCLLW